MTVPIRSRVVERAKMRFDDLMDHPLNPKFHPPAQEFLVNNVLAEIGFVGSIPAYYSDRNGGKLTLIDGHLRRKIAPDFEVDVDVHDLTDAEADILVALYDYSAMGAEIDPSQFDALSKEIGVDHLDNAAFKAAFADMASMAAEFAGAGGESTPSDGSLLAMLEVTIDDPRHKVEPGQVWQLGNHVLICCNVLTEWEQWRSYLKDGVMFAPYAGPFVSLSLKASKFNMVMVQPDPYIAGHILDRYEEIEGEEAIKLVK